MKKFIIESNSIIIKPFEKETISKKFISFLNNSKVNEHLTVKKRKQTRKSVLAYLAKIEKEQDLYLAIFAKKNYKNKIIGSATIRRKKLNSCYVGYMIGDPKYFGTNENKDAFKIIISFSFSILKYKQVLAGATIGNIASNFFLLKNGFKIIKKTNTDYYYKLVKKNFKKNIKFKYYEES